MPTEAIMTRAPFRMSYVSLVVTIVLLFTAGTARSSERPPAGHGKYVVVLWEPGTPKPDGSGDPIGRIPEPDFAAYGGSVLAKRGNRRVVYLPRGVAKNLHKHEAVAYIQRIWTGEPANDWDDPYALNSDDGIGSDSEVYAEWGPKAYTYDPRGNIIAIGTDQFTYDGLDRLKSASIAGVMEQYRYDSFGNLVERALPGSTVTIAVDSASNRLIGPQYDAAGNVTSSGLRTYGYDSLNMVTSTTTPAGTRRILYDADDERIGTIIDDTHSRWTIRDFEGQIVREFRAEMFDGISPVWIWEQDHFRGEGLLVAGDTQPWKYSGDVSHSFGGLRHYHLDHLGSVRMVSDAEGRSLREDDYRPFGTNISRTQQEQLNWGDPHVDGMRFAGHWRDFLGYPGAESNEYVDYMHARYYDPHVGRFLSVDPKGASAKPSLPQTWNRYAYARNNPLKYIDPDGQDVYIVVTNIVVDDTRVNSRPGGAGVNETVPAYKIVMMSEAGYVDTFAGSRDTNYSGKTMNTRGEYGSNHEAPPGTYFGKLRTDGKLGPRIELSDKKGGSTIAGPDGTRSNIQIHVGPGCSQGCVLLTGGKSNRDAFINSVEFMQEEERAAGRSDQIHVIVQPRNSQECSGDRCELNPK